MNLLAKHIIKMAKHFFDFFCGKLEMRRWIDTITCHERHVSYYETLWTKWWMLISSWNHLDSLLTQVEYKRKKIYCYKTQWRSNKAKLFSRVRPQLRFVAIKPFFPLFPFFLSRMRSGAIWTLEFGKHYDIIVVNKVRKTWWPFPGQFSKKILSDLNTLVENYQ